MRRRRPRSVAGRTSGAAPRAESHARWKRGRVMPTSRSPPRSRAPRAPTRSGARTRGSRRAGAGPGPGGGAGGGRGRRLGTRGRSRPGATSWPQIDPGHHEQDVEPGEGGRAGATRHWRLRPLRYALPRRPRHPAHASARYPVAAAPGKGVRRPARRSHLRPDDRFRESHPPSRSRRPPASTPRAIRCLS